MWEHSEQPWEGRLQAANPCISLQHGGTAAGQLGTAPLSLNLGTLPKVTHDTPLAQQMTSAKRAQLPL